MDIAFFLKTLPGFVYKKLPTDVRILKGDLEKDRDLQTAILLSLFTNRRAEPYDSIPSDDFGGWWGDKYLNQIADNQQAQPKLGSRLWLLKRGKVTTQTLNFARLYAREALQWLVNDGVLQTVNVDATAFKQKGIFLTVKLIKPDNTQLIYSYAYLWKQVENIADAV